MKTSYTLKSLAIIFSVILSPQMKSNANWINDGNKNPNSAITSKQTIGNKKALLPDEVNYEWLKNVDDGNGNKILSSENNPPETDDVPFNLTMTGQTEENYFGISVSSAGDVNADGYKDVIVGAIGYDGTRGTAYIFFGGSPMDSSADIVMNGEYYGNNFGYSVSSAGDVNLDGYSDVIVGAFGYNKGDGKAYIFFGGSPMNNVPDVILVEPGFDYNFGFLVASAGDVNGDFYSDVIVAASYWSYVFYGGAQMNNVSDVIIMGIDYSFSLSSAGDVNSDGYSDVIIGGQDNSSGIAYIFYGGTSMDGIVDVICGGYGYSFGASVSSAGDVNSDGFSDVIVGEDENSSAYIFLGGSPMNNVADVTMTGTNDFGRTVSTAGDYNMDGYSDVIVGRTDFAYIFYGGAPMNNTADLTMFAETANTNFASSLSSAGDLNRDGYSDIIIGAWSYNNNTGRAYIYLTPTIPASALKFDGNLDFVYLPNSLTTAATGGTAITIEYWFKGSYMQSAVRFQPEQNDYIIAGWNGMHIISSDGGTSGISVGAAATDGNWHHIAMTWQKNTVNGFKSFLDGNLISQRNSVNANLPALNGGGYLGSYLNTAEFMNGTLDEVRIWNRALPQSEIQIFRNCEYISQRPGLLAYYKFNHGCHGGNNTAITTLTDYSGNNYTATLGNFSLTGLNSNFVSPGGVVTGINCGNLASSLNFDGVNDNVSLNPLLANSVSNTTAISIEYWFKGISNHSAVRIQSAVDPNIFIVAGWNGQHIISSDGGTSGIPVGAAASDGNWHHVAMVWQRNTVNGFRSYLDGQLVAQRNSADVNLPPFSIFTTTSLGSFGGTQEFMNGTLDEVRIWNYARTQGEIQNRMNCEIVGSTPGLLANYHFNQGMAPGNNTGVTTLEDASGNGLNGVLNNFTLNGSSSNWVYPGGVISGTTCIGGSYYITAVPEGLYNSSTNASNRRDTIRAYLRSNVSPYGIVDSARSKMDSLTLEGNFVFLNAPSGTYYIQLKHRNSIETWSSANGQVYTTGSTNQYNFTNDAPKAYGNNMKQVDNSPVRFAIYSGDVNQDGAIDLVDITNIYNSSVSFTTGYVVTDLDGNYTVDLSDITLAYNNSVNFVSVINP